MKIGSRRSAQTACGWLGVLIALPFFVWVPLGFFTGIPSMVDVFGLTGIRLPAAAAISGLLIAAVGFHEI